MSLYSLLGRIAIVTGASRRAGIGAATCQALAEAGADIFFTYLNAYDAEMPWGVDSDGPEALKTAIEKLGVRCRGFEVNQAEPESAAIIIDRVEEELGKAAILVNNATYSVDADYQTLNAQLLDAHYAINMRGRMLLSVEFARRYKGGPEGRIINLTSGQALGPMPGELPYIATKGAVEAFTTSLAAGVAEKGITVNAVNPGPTDTGWMTEEIKQAILPRFPQGRIGQPGDVARLIAFLASDAAQWITGQVIHSEGGFRRG
ncbi:MAG TPA: SDR family oxidoreductase [Chloroflexia bacterium]|nr:SDR family oxidoreductase [Chloroflexia bacterium]